MSNLSPETVDYIENLRTMARAKAFLGREFLSWLWYRIEQSEGHLKVAVKSDDKKTHKIQAWIDDRVVLDTTGNHAHSLTLKGGDPSHSVEANASLRSGKSVREFKLGMEIDGIGPFRAVLSSNGVSSNGLSPRSLTLPEELGEEFVKDEPMENRIRLISMFIDVLDGLFLEFLNERSQPSWEKTELQKLRSWLKTRKLSEPDSLH